MKSVVLIEGFAGGPRLSHQFRTGLQKAGFRLTKDRASADIIIAHSAGCYDLPLSSRAGLIMLIGPPYWPGSPILRRAAAKISSDRRAIIATQGRRYWLRKRLFEVYYLLIRPKYLWLALKSYSELEFLELLEGKKVILIRNQDDKYAGPALKKTVKDAAHIDYIELAGQHDDYYTNPQPYIELLLREL
jgi:hypothetical protein